MFRRWDFWFGLIGVLGVAFAIFTYFSTNKVGRLSYSYDTQKVFDPANLSGFTLVTPDKKEVAQPVFATDIVIWNSGDLSLSDISDRVREPLKITFEGFIYYHIVARTNLVSTENYRVEISEDRSTITINWKFMDPTQGIRLTILHSANATTEPALSGRFFESSIRRQIQRPAGTKPETRYFLIVGILLAITGCATMWISLRFFGDAPSHSGGNLGRRIFRMLNSRRFFIAGSGAIIVEGITILALTGYLWYHHSVPPI